MNVKEMVMNDILLELAPECVADEYYKQAEKWSMQSGWGNDFDNPARALSEFLCNQHGYTRYAHKVGMKYERI